MVRSIFLLGKNKKELEEDKIKLQNQVKEDLRILQKGINKK